MTTTVHKCQCGDRSCKQYVLSTQGSVGFDLETATKYAATDDLLLALESAIWMIEAHEGTSEENDRIVDAARAAISKARGQTK